MVDLLSTNAHVQHCLSTVVAHFLVHSFHHSNPNFLKKILNLILSAKKNYKICEQECREIWNYDAS